jgi:hypothetical protein
MSLIWGHQRAYYSSPGDRLYEHEQPWLNDIDRRKSKISEKTLFQCLTVHHKCTWTEPGTNLRLRAEMHATNHLSHGTASWERNSGVQYRILGFYRRNSESLGWWLTLLLRIWEVPVSNLGPETGHSGWTLRGLHSHQENVRISP